LSGLVDGALGVVLLAGAALVYGVIPSASWLCLPLILGLCALTTTAIAVVLAALNVRFRDVQHVVPFFTQIFFFLSPVVYSADALSAPWRTLYALNPLVGIIGTMRWAVAGSGPLPVLDLSLSVAVTLGVLVGGGFVFRNLERRFADVI
jgi:lipopolysaccharide transport system permease protein